jgi:energy-coupling factor transporter ATP-binding protein EcfA2
MMRRIAVTGTPGSGKSTLARQLAARLNLPYIELAADYWLADWQPAPPERFRQQVIDYTAGEAWVIDGLYHKDITWARADTLVWLDYPLALVGWRLLKRTIRRIVTGETVGAGSRETLRHGVGACVSALRGHHQRRRDYARKLSGPAYAHLRVVRLRSPRAAAAWLRGID